MARQAISWKKLEKIRNVLFEWRKSSRRSKKKGRPQHLLESDSTDSEVDEIVYVEDKSGTRPSNHASSFSVTTQGHTISWKTGNIAQERVSVK